MNEQEKRAHALRIAEFKLDNIEYSDIYEDDELMDEDEEVWNEVFDLIRVCQITLPD